MNAHDSKRDALQRASQAEPAALGGAAEGRKQLSRRWWPAPQSLARLARKVLRVAARQPLIRSAALRILRLAPGLAPRLRRLVAPQAAPPVVLPLRELSPRAAAILADMQKVIQEKGR